MCIIEHGQNYNWDNWLDKNLKELEQNSKTKTKIDNKLIESDMDRKDGKDSKEFYTEDRMFWYRDWEQIGRAHV